VIFFGEPSKFSFFFGKGIFGFIVVFERGSGIYVVVSLTLTTSGSTSESSYSMVYMSTPEAISAP